MLISIFFGIIKNIKKINTKTANAFFNEFIFIYHIFLKEIQTAYHKGRSCISLAASVKKLLAFGLF